jgi:hypothetical protein
MWTGIARRPHCRTLRGFALVMHPKEMAVETLSVLVPTKLSSWPRRTAKLMLLGAAVVNLLPGAAYALSKSVLPDLGNRAAQAPAIKQIVSNCILEPGSSGDCNPGVVFTRGEFAAAAQRMFGLMKPTEASFFADVPANSPIYAAVQAAAPFMNRHILCMGCMLSDNFSPDAPISHAEVAVVLVRILIAANKVKLLSPADAERILARFPDATIIPAPARPYIATAVKSGIIAQFPRKKLEPAATYNRAEGATVLEYVEVRFGFLHDDDHERHDDDRDRHNDNRDRD